MALVVIVGDDQVEFARGGAVEHGVAGEGAGGVDPPGARRGDGGGDLPGVAVSEQPAFAAMGVETGADDTRPRASHVAEVAVSCADAVENARLARAFDGVGERAMGRDVDRLEALRSEQHERRRRAGEALEELGMTVVTMARHVQRRLVERGGDDGVDGARHRQLHRPGDTGVGGVASGGGRPAVADFVLAGAFDLDDGDAAGSEARSPGQGGGAFEEAARADDPALGAPLRRKGDERLADDFRADPARIPRSDGDGDHVRPFVRARRGCVEYATFRNL